MTTPDESRHDSIDAALAIWRQGDCVLEGEHWFAHRTESVDHNGNPEIGQPNLAELEVPGFVVLSQTCDIVRKYKDRPYVAVSPLVEVSATHLPEIRKGYWPRYAAISATSTKMLVADLDRVMTIDKQVVSGWVRIPGCADHADARYFSGAIERKFGRFAFPTDFVQFSKKLENRMKEKHDKKSDEGDALRRLVEIRVRAAPSWESPEVELMIWFVANAENVSELRRSGFLETWQKLVTASGRFKKVYCQIATHQELTAQDYLESDQLDLDHLSEG